MTYRSLRDFLARLEKDGELVRVRQPVSTVLEMTEIQTRLIAQGGPAVIFEKPVRADGRISRVWISVISSTVETGSFTRTSSPSFSRRTRKSRRER